jgi:hypothetical protein
MVMRELSHALVTQSHPMNDNFEKLHRTQKICLLLAARPHQALQKLGVMT